jgi:hypothetical protein
MSLKNHASERVFHDMRNVHYIEEGRGQALVDQGILLLRRQRSGGWQFGSQPYTNNSRDPISKKPITEKDWSVARSVGSEFKPQ